MNLCGICKFFLNLLYNSTKAKIKYKDVISESFTFNEGVDQGDGLSSTLFIIALHHAIKDSSTRNDVK